MSGIFDFWLNRRFAGGKSGKDYIQFADPAVESVVVGRWGDGVGLTKAVAATITELPYRLFRNNTSIVTFDELEYFTGLTTIAQDCFSGCTNLTSIKLPESITTIAASAFYNCTQLSIEVYLPNLTSIGKGAFCNTAITKVTSLGSITTITSDTGTATRCFGGCTSLTQVVLPNTVTTIMMNSFNGCTNLVTINLPTAITTIGNGAFQNCNALHISVNLPNLTSLGTAAFQFTDITDITSLGSITELGGSTQSSGIFRGCPSLASAVLPSTLTDIGNYTFNNCSALTEISSLATTPPTAGGNSFIYQCSNLAHIKVPEASVTAYKEAQYWSAFASIIEAIPS